MMTTEPQPFATEIKQAREALKLSQEQWAKRLGVSARTISRWESGDVEPNTAAQKATIAQAVRAAGLSDTLPGLANLAAAGVAAGVVGLALPPFGVVGALANAAVVASQVQSTKRGLKSARKRLQILDTVITGAESLGLVPERLAVVELALLDAALVAGISLQELRELLADEMIGA